MIYSRVIVFIVFQVSTILFASDEKKLILSQQDHDWLGKEADLILQSKKPQLNIASHIGRAVKLKDLVLNSDNHLQENIKHAQNWLCYFNKISVLSEEDQLLFCKNLTKSVLHLRLLRGCTENFQTSYFLKLFDYGINVGEKPLIKRKDSFIKFYNIVSVCPSLVNNVIYFYNPSLDFLETKVRIFGNHFVKELLTREKEIKPFLRIMEHNCWFEHSGRIYGKPFMIKDFKKMFTPIMYEVTEERCIKYSYHDVQKKVEKKLIPFLCALKVWDKEKQIKIPKRLFNTHILSLCSDVMFLKYCNQVQQDVGSQIQWIKENETDYYYKNLIRLPFLASAEHFKEWYEELKYSDKKGF